MEKSLILIIVLCGILGIVPLNAQEWVVKSNVLYDLAGTFNIASEARCGYNSSFQLGISYNPWQFSENKKMKQLMVKPEYRYWFNETFVGSFVGVQGYLGQYNVGNIGPFNTLKNNRYQGTVAGAGLCYGFQWMLNALWSLEASLAVGYAYLDYKKYGPKQGDMLKDKSHYNYWGPTHIGVSLVYFIY